MSTDELLAAYRAALRAKAQAQLVSQEHDAAARAADERLYAAWMEWDRLYKELIQRLEQEAGVSYDWVNDIVTLTEPCSPVKP